MFFTRTHTYHFPVPQNELKDRLIGNHVKIHDLDFEIMERDEKLTIIPHAEQISDIKTLPITHVSMSEAGGKTKVVVTSKMRALDSGGPFLIVIFCAFMLIAASVMYLIIKEPMVAYTLFGISAGIFTIFWIRLEMGYFDYVRKVHAFVKTKANPSTSGARALAA